MHTPGEPCRLLPRIADDWVDEAPSGSSVGDSRHFERCSRKETGTVSRKIGSQDPTLKRSPLGSPPTEESETDAFTLYIAAISEVPLLTPEGERDLGREMQLARETMTQALSQVPAAVGQFLEAYEVARKNQWELGHVVLPPPRVPETASQKASTGGHPQQPPQPLPDVAGVRKILEQLKVHYGHWQASRLQASEVSQKATQTVRHAMQRTFAALPVAPEMLRRLCATCRGLVQRTRIVEQRVGAVVILTDGDRGGLSLTSEFLGQRLLEPRFAPYRELIRAAQSDLHKLESAVGTDLSLLRKAHTEAETAWCRYEHAWRRLVEANLRLVISIARHFVRDGIALADLVQEGNLGLFRASEKFDYRLGYRFSTYASFWIRQAVSRALPKQGRLITVPRYMHDHITHLRALTASLQQKLVRNPSLEELTEAASLPLDTILTALSADQRTLSLETPTNDEEDLALYDRLIDRSEPDPSEHVNGVQVAERVARLLDSLSEREALILRLHYGIGGSRTMTLEQIATILGVTRERVRQLEVQALAALRSDHAVELLESLAD
ncbi:MAG: RNA polymerase sigma factor RpoD/SigA [Gammaproteobacteria bacterium]